MEALEFKLQGKMAHFRKYYSNSTALSYYVPPVTTIKGLLAGLIGRERDSYYEEFSNKQCLIGIAIDMPLRKITQTMNLLKVEKIADLSGTGTHTQNNTEWIIPENIRTGILSYTVVVAHKNPDIMNALCNKIVGLSDGYLSDGIALALGSAQCQGWISEGRKIKLVPQKASNEKILSRFAIPVKYINKMELYQNCLTVKKEETITEFNFDKDIKLRCITQKSKESIMISGNGKPIVYQLKQGSTYWGYEEENLVLLGGENDNMGAL